MRTSVGDSSGMGILVRAAVFEVGESTRRVSIPDGCGGSGCWMDVAAEDGMAVLAQGLLTDQNSDGKYDDVRLFAAL